MDRRTFLARAGIVATWASIPITVSDCGKDTTMGPGPGGGNGDKAGSVETVEGHTHGGAVVTAAELQAGNAVTLTLAPAGGPYTSHTHQLKLTAQEVTSIGAGTVTVQLSESGPDGHQHHVTFN